MAREFIDKKAEILLNTAANAARLGKKEFTDRKQDEVGGPDRIACVKGAGPTPPGNLRIESRWHDDGVIRGEIIELVMMQHDGTIIRAGKGQPTTVEKPSDPDRIAPHLPDEKEIAQEKIGYFFITQSGMVNWGRETFPNILVKSSGPETTSRDIRSLLLLLGNEAIVQNLIQFVIYRNDGEVIWGGKDLPTVVERPHGLVRDNWGLLMQGKPMKTEGLSLTYYGTENGSYSDRLDIDIQYGDQKKSVSIPFSEDSRIEMPEFGKRIDISPNTRTDRLVTAYLEISDL